MQVQQIPLFQFLEGSEKNFVIPVYQHDYAWTTENCKKLWEDLALIIKENRKDHFLGTIVAIGSGYEEYTIIDGQQRLTTASILLKSLHNFLGQKNSKSKQEEDAMSQMMDLLINRYTDDFGKKIRLKPNKQDKQTFDQLFGENILNFTDSNITRNYKFFYDKLNTCQYDAVDFFKAFRKLKIVLINLVRNEDDPQLIFESLNSTGVDLTAGDLIRNYILMDLEPREQERLYQNYWVKIEELLIDVAEYVRIYLIYKTSTSVKKDDVYSVFKAFSKNSFDMAKEEILKDLVYFGRMYSVLVQTSQHGSKNINGRLIRLNKLEFTVAHPYLLNLFFDFEHNILPENVVVDVLITLESYAFRKILVDNSTQGLNKFFVTLAREIKKEPNWEKEYINILNFILLEKMSSQKFPSNQDFENALIYKDIYNLQSKNKNFLLETLNNFKSAYPVNLSDLTIEHIMPQTLSNKWKDDLGVNWNDIQKKYLHTLGNLSLTAKNSELSNHSFEEKQKIDFQNSKLELNFNVNNASIWNEKSIISRSNQLAQEAISIWPYPISSYRKKNDSIQLFDLNINNSLSGFKPIRLIIDNSNFAIDVKTWRELLCKVCGFLYEISPNKFNKIEKYNEFKINFAEVDKLRSPMQYANNKFTEGNMSANSIVAFLLRLCDKLEYPADNISFAVRDIKE